MSKSITKGLYTIGFSAILTAIIYFFAANWSGIDKTGKILLSIGLVILFYILGYLVTHFIQHHPFLGNWLYFAGSLAYGVCVILLFQIYHLQADHYVMFLIWLVPVAIAAFLTRYEAYFIVSFILIEVTTFQFFSQVEPFSSMDGFVSALVFSAVNGVLFVLIRKGVIASAILERISYALFFVFLLLSTYSIMSGVTSFVVSVLIAAGTLFLVRYWTRDDGDQWLVGISYAALGILAITEYWRLSMYFMFLNLFGGILFAGGLIFAVVKFSAWQQKRQKNNGPVFGKKFLYAFAAGVASVVGSSSITGTVYALFDMEAGAYATFFLGLVLIGIAVFNKDFSLIAHYTLLTTGFFLVTGTFYSVATPFAFLFLAAVVAVLLRSESRGMRGIALLNLNILSVILFLRFEEFFYTTFEGMDFAELLILILLSLNLLAYLFDRLITVDALGIENISLVLVFIAGLALTFIGDVGELRYLFYNFLFVGVAIGMTFLAHRLGNRISYYISLFFWFAFLVLKYYDFGWKLLHKSIGFAILGILFILLAVYLERRNGIVSSGGHPPLSFVSLMIVLVVQMGAIGGTMLFHEQIIQKGETIKLALAPVDPRSLLQGDYLELNFEISELELTPQVTNETILVVLREGDDGVHHFEGTYSIDGHYNQPYTAQDGDVHIKAEISPSGRARYGIENYFIEEGTGLELEEMRKYAIVKVSQKGTPLLQQLTNE